MGMSVGGRGGPQSDINVTPLVDIVLVLLIIFMVITPMLNEGVEVRLPKAKNVEVAEEEEEPVIVSVAADGIPYFGPKPVTLDDLETELISALYEDAGIPVVIKADFETRYAAVRDVMKVCEKVGAKNVKLQADESKRAAEDEDKG
jgi:biopolymer transport protein TolR